MADVKSDVIVVPCFNEADRMPVDEVRSFLEQNGQTGLCFVDDGSSDRTPDLLNGLRREFPDSVSVVLLRKNQGKAEAVRQGVLHVCRSTDVSRVAYFDADLATPLADYATLARCLESRDELQMVFGSRVKRLGTVVHRKVARHWFGRIFATLVSCQLGLPVYDTQCGAKVFRREICECVFGTPFSSRWFFDVEIFHRLILAFGRERVGEIALEVPLPRWIDKGRSKVGLMDFVKTPWELARIGHRYGGFVRRSLGARFGKAQQAGRGRRLPGPRA